MSTTTTFAYDSNNELQSMTATNNGATPFTYDDWGRTTTETLPSGTVRTYTWTSANMLAGVDSNDPNDTDVTYACRGDLLSMRGRRVILLVSLDGRAQ